MSEPERSPLADYHISQGAVLGTYHGGLVPARFSDAVTEQQAVRNAAGVFDYSFRGKIVMKGVDRVRFLNGMVTNDLGAIIGFFSPSRSFWPW